MYVLIMAQPSEEIKKTQVTLVPFFLGHTLVYWKPNSDIYAKSRKKESKHKSYIAEFLIIFDLSKNVTV